MAVTRTRSNGVYAALGAYYYQDDRVGDAGPMGELLFVRSLAYCAGKFSDGFMTDRQVRLYVAVGLDDVDDLVKRLVSVGLWDRDEGRDGYQIRNFLKWNRSLDEITYQRDRDAARKRAERRPADGPPPGAGIRAESGGTSDRSTSGRAETSAHHNTPQHNTSHEASGRTPSGTVRPEARPVAATPPDLTPVRQKISDSIRAKRQTGKPAGPDGGTP